MLERLELGFATTIISMAIVFIVLIGLSYLIRVQRSIVEKIEGVRDGKKAPEAPKPVEQVKPVVVEAEDSEELVAVITAAVAAVLGRPTSNIKIKSIRGLDSWAVAGRQDQIGSRF